MNPSDSTGGIKASLWTILLALKAGELDPENAEQMISALDSLISIERLDLDRVKAAKKFAGNACPEDRQSRESFRTQPVEKGD